MRQRTQVANALRGHAAEFGVVAAKGIGRIEALMATGGGSRDAATGQGGAGAACRPARYQIDAELAALDRLLAALHAATPLSRLLAAVPGIGPLTALTLALGTAPERFANGRHFAAWLGLTPKLHATAGRPRLGGISRAGNERLRQLLVLGATAVIRHARPGTAGASPWLLALLGRKPRKLAAVALANKIARVGGTPRSLLRGDPVWAMMARGEAWRGPEAATP